MDRAQAIGEAVAELIHPMLKGITFTEWGIEKLDDALRERGFEIVPVDASKGEKSTPNNYRADKHVIDCNDENCAGCRNTPEWAKHQVWPRG